MLSHDEDGIELDQLSHALSDAISHAFTQPDHGFLTNGGALPIIPEEEEEDIADTIVYPRPWTTCSAPHNEAVMSGALGDDSSLDP